jgi:ubiquinone/menaquinone biosynthesis C-methylase UbiE
VPEGDRSGSADVTVGHLVAGTVGLSLLRHWYVDGEVNDARLEELRDVLRGLDDPPLSTPLNPAHRPLDTGYTEWADTYDDGANPMIEAEEAAVRPVLATLAGPGVRALDAACGTGRHAAFLAGLGCSTVGVDQSEAMLAVARAKAPEASFQVADLRELPFADGAYDLAVVSLALSHLADPTGALVELGRVLRGGGTLVVADPHPSSEVLGGQAFYGEAGRNLSWVRNHYHSASTWVGAFRAAGLLVEDCQEPLYTDAQLATNPTASLYPQAMRGAAGGLPCLWVWVLRAT